MQFSTSFSLPSSALISSFFSAVRSQFLPPSFRICEFLPNLHRKFLIYDQRTWCRQLGKNCFLNFFLYHYLSACDCMIGKVIRQTINFARSMHYLTCYNVKGSLVILLSLWWMKKKQFKVSLIAIMQGKKGDAQRRLPAGLSSSRILNMHSSNSNHNNSPKMQ